MGRGGLHEEGWLTQANTVFVLVISTSTDEKWYRTAFNWVCGIEKHEELEELTPDEIAEMKAQQISLAEEKFWRKFCNIQAVILLTVTTFYWGFFSYSEFTEDD